MTESAPSLPLPADALPASIRRFGDPKAPGPARTMAAKGLVPVKGEDLVFLLLQLSADADPGIAGAARETFEGLPRGVVAAAARADLPAPVLAAFAVAVATDDAALEPLVQNPAIPTDALARVAERCSERMSEVIATNQQRLLEAPIIVEALYKNRNTRMSTADRLIELCARNGVRLDGIPAFDAHVEAIAGQLIPEPSDEALPTDRMFQEALEADADDPDAVERDAVDGSEEVKEDMRPLSFRIRDMNAGERIRLAIVGDAAARAILVRDPARPVAMAAITSPRMVEREASTIAHSKEVDHDILRYIGTRRDWVRSYEVKRALVFNPKTPLATSMGLLSHMRDNDLKSLSRSRGVAQPIKNAAKQRLAKKQGVRR